ncbi:hypothetical protein ACWD5F_19725 [Streptomyces sp. NPDC002499]|jgi:hypothetical protein
MPTDPYAILRALLRAEAVRSEPKPAVKKPQPERSPAKRER